LLQKVVCAGCARLEGASRDGKDSRPCSPAKRAVTSEPERWAPSATTTPRARRRSAGCAAWKVLRTRAVAWSPFTDEKALFANLLLEGGVLGWVDDVEATGDDRKGPLFETCGMSGGVDAARELGGYGNAFEPQPACDLACEFLADRGTVACADNGDDRHGGEFKPTLHIDQGRGCLDLCQGRGVSRFSVSDEVGTDPCSALQFSLGVRLTAEPDGVCPSTASRKGRLRVDRCLSTAELIDERTKRRRTHVLAP